MEHITPLFDKVFSNDGNKAEITVEDWIAGWVSIVHGNNGIPTAQDFNTFGYILDSKINALHDIVANFNTGLKVYNSFAEIDESYSATTSIVSVIRKMEVKSILYVKISEPNTRYPNNNGILRIEKYANDTAALLFDCLEGEGNNVPTKYFSYCTPSNIETIFGGVS